MADAVTIGDAMLYCCDFRVFDSAARGHLPRIDSIITDPVWPNCPPSLYAGADGQQSQLLADAVRLAPTERIVVVLGFDSDPRFLSAIPDEYPFIRSQQLPYAFPSYRGRLLAGDEMAYVFGSIPKGQGVIPGRARAVASTKKERATGHPSPRADAHMLQLVGWWARGTVLDPFMGTGAVGVGCAEQGLPYVGIEIDRRYFDIACVRIENAQRQARMFA
jgi:hypothetical protein